MLYIVSFLFYVYKYEMLSVIQSIHHIVEVTPKRALAVFTYLFAYLTYLFNLFIYLVKVHLRKLCCCIKCFLICLQ